MFLHFLDLVLFSLDQVVKNQGGQGGSAKIERRASSFLSVGPSLNHSLGLGQRPRRDWPKAKKELDEGQQFLGQRPKPSAGTRIKHV